MARPNNKKEITNMKAMKYLLAALFALLLTACGDSINTVKDAYLNGYERTTVGNAFDAYFENPKWELKELPNKTKVVIFTGTKSMKTEISDISRLFTVTFILNNNGTFEIEDKVSIAATYSGGGKSSTYNEPINAQTLIARVYGG